MEHRITRLTRLLSFASSSYEIQTLIDTRERTLIARENWRLKHIRRSSGIIAWGDTDYVDDDYDDNDDDDCDVHIIYEGEDKSVGADDDAYL